ncbi:TetR/AcrR family transcriptional regulator [Arthrobacter sp. AL08]|uniref:TetR/AcrR family transcriptional regulator n=1 Tax=unclassified Arthrobacter TaxID=235627 RepID=UPI00249B4D6F|nr:MULTISPECIES: TetR/AcrR family transcriptional regulator [unclassified Arthrobacter]MDI3243412.1 TetR/AcrR family transcriptional regulator [Arthrobacter sp. AL05]MDI3279435.1 TetR/AcrR family transcriptional regulator [Arthrobacter sp. AL08]
MPSHLSKGSATRQRLTQSMLQLIQTAGYHGAGLTAVLEHSAAPKGSLYFHFPGGKAELGSAAVSLAAEQFGSSIRDAVAVCRSFEELVDTVISELASLLVSSDYRAGCPVAAVTLDAGAEDEQLRVACSDAYTSWIATFHAYLASLSASDTDDTHNLATSSVCLIEGALVVCRAQKTTEPLVSASHTLKGLLGPILKQGGAQ